jgi:hypothetical protein
VFFVYCVIVFTAVIFAKLNLPTGNCNDTVVNWFIKEQFCNLHVWFMFIRAMNPFFFLKKMVKIRRRGVHDAKQVYRNAGMWSDEVKVRGCQDD